MLGGARNESNGIAISARFVAARQDVSSFVSSAGYGWLTGDHEAIIRGNNSTVDDELATLPVPAAPSCGARRLGVGCVVNEIADEEPGCRGSRFRLRSGKAAAVTAEKTRRKFVAHWNSDGFGTEICRRRITDAHTQAT